MQKYSDIIGKRIKMTLDGKEIAAYRITFMNPELVTLPYVGICYKCACEWEASTHLHLINNSPPMMEFPEDTLQDLCTKGVSQSPIMDNMQFVVDTKN